MWHSRLCCRDSPHPPIIPSLAAVACHTSAPPSDWACSLQGIFHFQLGRGEPMLHTRLRPHCKEFLEKVARLYELHVFTFGSRLYAHTIAGEQPMGFCPALDTQRPACGFGSSPSQRWVLQMEGRSEALPDSASAPWWWLGAGRPVLQNLCSAWPAVTLQSRVQAPVPLSAARHGPLERLVRSTDKWGSRSSL